jgi:hypothetical protein
VKGLEFIAALVHSVAWPVTVIVLAFLFRQKLATIPDRILEAKFGKFTLKLQGADQLLKAAKRELQPPKIEVGLPTERHISPPPTGKRQIISRVSPETLPVTEVRADDLGSSVSAVKLLDPSIRIDLAWNRLTRDVLAAARGTGMKGTRSLRAAISHLVAHGLVPSAFEDAFENVKATYNAIQRNPNAEVDEALAQDFLAACEQMDMHATQILTH